MSKQQPTAERPAKRLRAQTAAEARLARVPPVYLGHSPPTREVQALIQSAVQQAARIRTPVLVSGAPGTGKRVVAEILHHFAGGETEALEQPKIERGRLAGLGEFSYVCPVEALSRKQQASLALEMFRGRVVLATRLDPGSDEGKRRLVPQLRRGCLHIRLPTLRERVEDLEALALRILWTSPSPRPIGGINDYALDCLRAYPWPGNVTELEEVLAHAIALGSSEQIELRDLPQRLRLRPVGGLEGLDLDAPNFKLSLAHAERTAIERALRFARGNKRLAARLLQISKTTLYRKLRCLDLDAELDE